MQPHFCFIAGLTSTEVFLPVLRLWGSDCLYTAICPFHSLFGLGYSTSSGE